MANNRERMKGKQRAIRGTPLMTTLLSCEMEKETQLHPGNKMEMRIEKETNSVGGMKEEHKMFAVQARLSPHHDYWTH